MMADEILWKLEMSIGGEKQHSLLYRSEFLGKGIQLEIHTPVKANGEFGKARKTFFIDGDKREFKSEDEIREVITESLKGAE